MRKELGDHGENEIELIPAKATIARMDVSTHARSCVSTSKKEHQAGGLVFCVFAKMAGGSDF